MTYADVKEISSDQALELRRQSLEGDPEAARGFFLYCFFNHLRKLSLHPEKERQLYNNFCKQTVLQVKFVG